MRLTWQFRGQGSSPPVRVARRRPARAVRRCGAGQGRLARRGRAGTEDRHGPEGMPESWCLTLQIGMFSLSGDAVGNPGSRRQTLEEPTKIDPSSRDQGFIFDPTRSLLSTSMSRSQIEPVLGPKPASVDRGVQRRRPRRSGLAPSKPGLTCGFFRTTAVPVRRGSTSSSRCPEVPITDDRPRQAPIATGWSDRAAGRESHPLKFCAFSRRTQNYALKGFE